MFIVEVEYLTGRAVATARHDREQPEWPPHPSRLFSALVAACHEADLTEAEREAGRAALRWLEKLPPPALAVTAASPRDVVPVFVPVNDSTIPGVRAGRAPSDGQIADAVRVLPERRPRQGRFFPSVTPEHAVVHFLWRAKPGAEGVAAHQSALDTPGVSRDLPWTLLVSGACGGLRRIVTSIKPTHEPAADGNFVFRVPARGRLDELERDYARQSRPSPGTYQAYREIAAVKPAPKPQPASAFSEMIVCRLGGPALPLAGTLRLTTAVRDAMIRQADRARPTWSCKRTDQRAHARRGVEQGSGSPSPTSRWQTSARTSTLTGLVKGLCPRGCRGAWAGSVASGASAASAC